MITLGASDTLAADADAATQLTYTLLGGMTLNGTTETYDILAQGQVAATVANIYTAPGTGPAFIRTISIVNTDLAASHTFQLFVNGTAATNAITSIIAIPAGGQAIYEDSVGWSITTVPVGTDLLNDHHTGYQDWDAISVPSAPGSNILRLFARKTAGRMLPKWIGPSGVDTFMQPALFGNNVVQFLPNTGTTAPLNTGTPWATGTTIGHPAPTAGMYTQMKRTTSTNVITTANQALGVSSIVSTAASFWVGSSAGLGGFFFFSRFGIETLTAGSPNATRLFVGLHSGTTNIVISDTIPAISAVGLWHDTTDGANVINLLTKDGTTATKNALTGSPTTPYSTGQGYDFYMFCKPADTTIYYRLDNLNTGAILVDSSVTTTIPNNAVFMGPNVGMSNGTANTTAATVGIGVNRIYIESDH
jgi:hypothetical protein